MPMGRVQPVSLFKAIFVFTQLKKSVNKGIKDIIGKMKISVKKGKEGLKS